MQRIILLLIIITFPGLLATFKLEGQVRLQGRVIDTDTEEPLPFVNIVYNERGTGTITNLDGYFTIESGELPRFLRLSYVGYEPLTVYPPSMEQTEPVVLRMTGKSIFIEEVTVRPGINPAHRIISQAFKNRRQNNPEMLSSFSYTSYNKLFVTLVPDSILSRVNLPGSPGVSIRFAFSGAYNMEGEGSESGGRQMYEPAAEPSSGTDNSETETVDSSEIRLRDLLEKQHLFLTESVSKREYRRPGRNNEQVVASRVSGFKDPSFSLLATQLQSFTFYEDFISLLDRSYLNPISRGSTSRYSFILEDSMFTQQDDTLFVISFKPYPDRNFDGLQGVVYINTNGYAVQNVIAEPYEPAGFYTIRIHQNYRFVDNKQWFPSELNTDIILGREGVSSDSPVKYRLVGIGKAYLSDIVIGPELNRWRFNHVELAISPDAHLQDELFWKEYRVEPLSDKEKNTYHVIDSIGEEANFDRNLKIVEALATGYIPWGYMNVDYNSLIDYNYFEGLRPGLRMITNDRLSEALSVGGHIGYGLRDKQVKYGGEAGLILYRPGDVNLRASYSRDVEEGGSHRFLRTDTPFSTENYRRFMIGRMDYVEKYDVSLTMRLLRHFTTRWYFETSHVTPGDEYAFLTGEYEKNRFRISEGGVKLRFAFGEKFMQTPGGNRISLGTDFPVVWLNYGRGLDIMNGEYEYTRVAAGVLQTFTTKSFGETSVMIEGGRVDGNVPFYRLYNGKGSYRNFSIEAANSFATMRMSEFVSDEFVSLFFRHNFGSLLFRRGNFRPEVVFASNAGFGRLSNPGSHVNIPVRSLDKGYYESGLMINSIIKQLFVGYGFGVFYRYGPYSYNRTIDNFAFKLTFNINFL